MIQKNKTAWMIGKQSGNGLKKTASIASTFPQAGFLIRNRTSTPVQAYTTAMKEASSIPFSAVGLLDNLGLCEHILKTSQADLILQGIALISNVSCLADASEQIRDINFEVYDHSYQRGQRRK